MASEFQSRFWRSAARSLARRINLGWWLERWMVWVMVAAIFGPVAVLLVRWMRSEAVRWAWCAVGAVLVIGALVAWMTGRRRFESAAAARVRLEDALGLKARLSAAEAGVGVWPEAVAKIDWPVRWRWQKPLGVCAFTAAMLLLAAWVPVTRRDPENHKRVIEKPSAVKDVEQWVQELRKEKAVDEKSAEETEKKIAELLKRPAENWYEHGSLEAAGNLKEETAAELREMAQNLADAERAASALEAMGAGIPQAVKDSLGSALGQAAKNLAAGGMRPNEELLQQMRDLGASHFGDMSPEDRARMMKNLKQQMEALQKALGDAPGFDPSGIPQGDLADGKGGRDGKDGKSAEDGDGDPGRGGINRGRGDAEMFFKKHETNLDTKKTEGLASQIDPSRIAPADVLAVTDGQHEVDKSAYKGPKEGGKIQNAGDGGSAVWQNSLMPAEREALKKYFK